MGTRGTSRNGTPRGTGAYASAHRQKRRWFAVLGVLAALVVFVTVYALMTPAATLTADGAEETTEEVVATDGEEITTDEEAEVEQASATTEEAEVAETVAAAALPDGAQVPDGYTEQYSFQDKTNGVAVTVYAPEGVVPEGATLSVALLSEDDDAYAEAEEALAADEDYGFAALDIRFEDAEGNEVESSGDVYVVINADGLLPDDADPSTVTVQHLAEDESGAVASVDTVADAADATDATDGVVNVSDDTNVQAAFSVDGFSTFTITWNNNTGSGLTVQIIDTKGNSIGSSNLGSLNISLATSISDIVEEIEERYTGETLNDYEFSKAVVATSAGNAVSGNGTAVERVRRIADNRWQYSTQTNGDAWSNFGGNSTLYFVYLTTVETVDSAAEGVHMYMFNYNSAAFSGGSYGSGDVKEGLASSTVNAYGWPTLTGVNGTPRNTSFSTYFGGTTSAYDLNGTLNNSGREVNNLFLQSYYEVDGTFYYSSFENFATLENDNDNDFTVYEELGSPNSDSNYYYQRGNFMPYNTLDVSNVQNYNYYDSDGERLSTDDERYGDPLYGFNETNDYYFGMYVWADFYQPQDGRVESNDGSTSTDMIFEFTGDDDMWVYIDGVLVLDLGGIHDAQSGYINFASGDVGYTDTTTGSTPAWNYTNLYKLFESAGREGSVNWDGDTFADGSSHRIQIFYMERGAGASNLKISFNLKTIPDGQLAVTKQVENYYAPQLADIEYTMQVEVLVNGNWVSYANQDYTLYEQEGGGTTDKDGQFKIKYGQTAIFSDIEVGTQVRVSEVGSSDTPTGSTIDQNYDISYVVTDGSGGMIEGSSTTGGYASASMPGYGSIRVTITNKATFTRPLKLVKNFSGTENNEAPDGFEATYTLYEQVTNNETNEAEWNVVGSVKYSDLTDGSYTFWLDVDKTYKIVETFEEGDNDGSTDELKWRSVTVTTNDPASGTESGDGVVYIENSDATEGDDVDTITMTNNYGATTLDINYTKVDATNTNTPLTGAEFKLYKLVTPGGEEDSVKYYYQVITGDVDSSPTTSWIAESEFNDGNQPTTLTDNNGAYTIYGLEDGTYYLEETKAPDGYQLPNEPITITISGGKVTNLACGSTSLIQFIDGSGLSFKVTNTTGTALPETGGSGTAWLTFGGVALIAAAACGFGFKRSRERRDASS